MIGSQPISKVMRATALALLASMLCVFTLATASARAEENWPLAGQNLAFSHDQPGETTIDTANVEKLALIRQ
jgi:hypothetical protein